MKTIIFDFGNVVAFFDHQRAIAKLAPHTDLPPTELTLQLYGSAIEEQYERHAIPTEEYVRLAKLNGRLTCSTEEFLAAFVDIFWRNDAVCRLIPILAKRYRLLLASNTNDAHYRQFTEQFADVLNPHFAELCASHKGGARKPQPEFFAYCHEFAKAEPHECVYVDDLAVNVEAAQRFGWRGIVYRPGDDLVARFRAMGVEV